MAITSKRKQVGIKEEATQGTAETLDATDMIEVFDFEAGPDTEILPRNPHSSSLDRYAHVTGKRWQEGRFRVDLKGSGTAGTAYAPLAALLKAAGFVQTTVASQGVQSVAVTGGGSGYTSAPTVTFTGGSGSGAAAIAIVVGGAVVAVFVTNPGSGYSSDPTVGFTGGGGSGATATATRGGADHFALTSVAASGNYYGAGKSCTIKGYEDGLLKVFAGCIGDPKLILEAGKIAQMEFSFRGVYAAVADASFPSNSPNTTAPPKFVSSSLYFHGFQGVVSKLEIGLNNQIAERPDSVSVNGLKGFQITGREPGGSFDPEAELVATHDFYGRFMAGTEGSLAFTVGTTSGNRCVIACPKTQYGRPATQDQNGLMRLNTPFMINRNTGDDSITLLFS